MIISKQSNYTVSSESRLSFSTQCMKMKGQIINLFKKNTLLNLYTINYSLDIINLKILMKDAICESQ